MTHPTPHRTGRTALRIGAALALACAAAAASAFEDAPDPTAIRLTARPVRGTHAAPSVDVRNAWFDAIKRTANDAPVMDRMALLEEERALLDLIAAGDVPATDEQWARMRERNRGHEALVAAVASGRRDLVKTLLAHGADPDHVAARGAAAGQTALSVAVLRDDAITARLLLQAGATADLKARNGMTPLASAIRFGRERVARELLVGGADPALELHGHTPLVQAAQWGRPAVIGWLVQLGQDPNEPDRKGDRPLQHAIAEQQVDAVRALLRAGADPKAIGMSEQTVLLAVGAQP